MKKQINVIGCGRTDAGVHASQFFFHAELDFDNQFDLRFRLNKVLPDDIAVFDIINVGITQHARFDAVERHYDYYFHTYKDPFLAQSSAEYASLQLDIEKMKVAARLLPRYTDYRAFCKSPENNKHTLCRVNSAALFHNPGRERYCFHIQANRFLTGMIRILMGKLLEVGAGRLSLDQFEYHLESKVRPEIIKPAFSEGLVLSRVIYPFLDLPVRANLNNFFSGLPDTNWLSV